MRYLFLPEAETSQIVTGSTGTGGSDFVSPHGKVVKEKTLIAPFKEQSDRFHSGKCGEG